MEDHFEVDPELPPEERGALAELAARLERERPLPAPGFRGELRRRLLAPQRAPSWALRWQPLAASYLSLGALCLAIAAAGVAGAGPFAA